MSTTPDRASRSSAGYGLDATNFFLADVRAGLGPYFAIYLLTGSGAALSTSLAGIVLVHGGYHAAFLALGAAACTGLVFGVFPSRHA
ncbi:MAG: hypothetical protein FWD68_21750 [Alphaproteobacteria bacterium]|nr:hypothetical protein [Alphaproteobacteria bacterium]